MLVRASGPAVGPPGASSRGIDLPEPAHVFDRDDDLQLQLLAYAGVHDGHRARWCGARPVRGRATRSPAPQVGGHRRQRPLRGRQADALRGHGGQCLQSLQRQRQVRATLGRRKGMDLIDDDPAHAAKRLARLRGQDEIEGFRRRHQDVRGSLAKGATLPGRCIAGAQAHAHLADGGAESLGGQGDAGQRCTEVAVDVVDQGLQGGDVEDAQALSRVRGLVLGQQTIQAPQEGGQRLAAAGGCTDQAVLPCGDGRPTLRLRLGGCLERTLEPRARGRLEDGERLWLIGPARACHGERSVPLRGRISTSVLARSRSRPIDSVFGGVDGSSYPARASRIVDNR